MSYFRDAITILAIGSLYAPAMGHLSLQSSVHRSPEAVTSTQIAESRAVITVVFPLWTIAGYFYYTSVYAQIPTGYGIVILSVVLCASIMEDERIQYG